MIDWRLGYVRCLAMHLVPIAFTLFLKLSLGKCSEIATTLVDACQNRNMIALGDSLTEGLYMNTEGSRYECCHSYVERLAQLLPKSCEIAMAGKSGEKANTIYERIPRHLALHANSKLFVILAGTNDLDQGLPNSKIIRDVLRLHKLALNSSSGYTDPIVYTIAVTIPPGGTRINPDDRMNINLQIKEYQQRCAARVALLDLDTIFNESDPIINEQYYCKDQLHFTPSGYDLFAGQIYETMQNFTITEDTLPPLPSSCLDLDGDNIP